MLHTTRNMVILDNKILRIALPLLQGRMPPGWKITLTREPGRHRAASVKLTAPDRRSASMAVEVRARLEPRGVTSVAEAAGDLNGPLVVVAPYLSEATREKLIQSDLGYVDLTGNVRIVLGRPGLFIETEGATTEPNRRERPARSLRGAKAGRIVRALVDWKRPPGVREMATLTDIDPGYVSRVLAYLDSQALVERVGRGRLESVDWPALLRRWAEDAPLDSRGDVVTCLAPRGLDALVKRLADSDERYAITGGLAAAAYAPLAPTRLGIIWMEGAEDATERLALRPADRGANVMLLDPRDESVFEGVVRRKRASYAAASQTAADLLTSPGRGPAEGEELLTWMQANEHKWRL
jgi:hypothetical protein